MRFAAIVAFPRFLRVYPSLPYPKEFFFLYARREICGAAHTSDDGGMCRKNGFFARKTSYFAFSTNALFRIRHFLTKSRKFPLSFFFVWQTGHTNQKNTRRARDVTPARFAPDRPPVGVVRAPPRQAAATARRAQLVFCRADRILRAAPQTSAPRLKRIRPQKNGRIELQTIYFVSPQAFKNLPNAALPCSSCLNTAVLSRMFSHTFSTYAVTIFSAFSSLFFVPCFASKE